MRTINDLDKLITREEISKPGHPLCAGCPGGIALRWITKVLGKNTLISTGSTCIVLPLQAYPNSVQVPSFYICMASTAPGMTGMRAALNVLQRKGVIPADKKINVVGLAGDGSTADIGMAALSGAAERNDDGIYFTFDNEAYMNTGVQRSSSTPQFTRTTTTLTGKTERKKDLAKVMIAHDIPYVATVSLGYPEDFIQKVTRARDMGPGFKYIHMHSPCPVGWRFAESNTVHVARLAVETGFHILYEVVDGKFRITQQPEKRKPVEAFLKDQARFDGITDEELKGIQDWVDGRWEDIETSSFCLTAA
ncbi:MAG: pyruvate synthase subunit beta [Deltaproteobacteria bacterium]|nr:pyruvate synthase subunit beta [Deltaproteobacteria bacterium]